MATAFTPAKVWKNGTIADYSKTRLGLLNHTFNYGTGVFEGIRCYWSEKDHQLYGFRLLDHYERFIRNARLLGIHIPYSAEKLRDATVELLFVLQYQEDCYIRPIAFIDHEAIGVYPGEDAPRSVVIIAIPFGDYIAKAAKGIALKTSSWRRIHDTMIPPRGKISGGYVNSYLATTEARSAGAQEALLLTHSGNVAEGSGQNIFLVRYARDKKGEVVHRTLITPPESDDILVGITRDSIFHIAKLLYPASSTICEISFGRSAIFQADECFLTGTASELMPVVLLDDHTIGDGNIGHTTKMLSDAFQLIVRNGDLRGISFPECTGLQKLQDAWLTPIYT